MATTFSALTAVPKGTVFGDKRVSVGQIVLSGVADTTKCGLSFVQFAVVTPATTTSSYHYNITSTGSVNIFSGTTGDIYNVIAYGK
jgi:Ethanolamine utilization protein EutJ (predicted chaperonin)